MNLRILSTYRGASADGVGPKLEHRAGPPLGNLGYLDRLRFTYPDMAWDEIRAATIRVSTRQEVLLD